MRRIIVFVFCLCTALAGRQALAADNQIYAPIAPASDMPAASSSSPTNANEAANDVNQPPAVEPNAAPVSEPASAPPASVPSVAEAVARGKNLLSPVLADFKSKEGKIKPLGSKTGATAAALAIWNKADDTVAVYGGTRGAKYFTADNSGPIIPIVSAAGSQTAYRDNDPNSVVVGTIQADMVKTKVKKKTVYKPSFAYYVPYNSELYSVETLAAGSDYLSNLIQQAFNGLEDNK